MFWTLVRKEILGQLLNIRFYISFALACLFLVPATYILANNYGWMHKEYGPYLTEGFYNPWGINRFWVNRQIPPLHVLVTGLDESLSLRSHNTISDGPDFGESQFVHNPLSDILPPLDFVFFVNMVGSLLAFAFTYDAVSGERQQGTVRLTMANPISGAVFILSKFLGNYLSLVISLLPALIGVILVLSLHPDVGFGLSDWNASFWLFVLALLNIGVFLMLGVFVSCVTREPKTTLTALMTIWVLLILVVPNFSPFVAAKLHPIPPLHQVHERITPLSSERDDAVRKEQEEFVKAHGGDHGSMSQQEKDEHESIWLEYRMNIHAKELTRVWEAFFNEMDAQAKLAQYLSRISPSAITTYLASDLSHTGIESEHAFRFATIRFRREYAANLTRYIQRTQDKTKLWLVDNKLAPAFVLPRPTVSQVISTHLLQFMALVLYGFLCFCGAQLAFIRSSI
jgi:ABC-type transport system involved in multi-copper enzyme maturation permease subunit